MNVTYHLEWLPDMAPANICDVCGCPVIRTDLHTRYHEKESRG